MSEISHCHDHKDQHIYCCPDHESLSEKQVQTRLSIALYAGVLLLVGFIAELSINQFSAVIFEFIAGLLLIIPILKDSYQALRNGRITFPCLVALAYIACIAQGDFLTAGLVALFMTLADQLENRTAIGAGKAIEELIQVTPNIIHLEKNGDYHDTPIEELNVGDIIQIRPGENAAIDGIILEGESTFDESSITGESLPIDKEAQDQVFAGTTNLTGLLRVKVEKVGDDTTVGKVKQLIFSAATSKTEIMSSIEKGAAWYTPAIVMFAAMVYFYHQDQENSLDRAISVLIMACPCSLVLATPSVMIAAITSAAKAGILIKRAVELEFFHRIEHFFFDKTGTLTSGNMNLINLKTLGDLNNSQSLIIAGSLCKNSNHPVSKGIYAALEKAELSRQKVDQLEEVHGKGLKGLIDSSLYFIGRPEWVSESIGLSNSLESIKGSRLILGSKEHGFIAEFILEDTLREDAKNCISQLKENGVQQVSLLTGDNWEPARKVGSALELDAIHAKCLPSDKLKHLESSKNNGQKTAVLGDGINDAPVLAAGDVGIAMGAIGSQVAIESASIALMGNSLNRIPFLQKLSKKSQLLIWVNILISIIVLIIGLVLSVIGLMSPVMAAIIHNLSALFILLNSARLVKFQPEYDE